MFGGFCDEMVDVGDARLRVRFGGQGPAVLLIHGHPRTGATWHRVAPRLAAAGLRVVCPDMRGYGRSSKSTVLVGHRQQSKRAVAGDLVELMRLLGHDHYAVVGHDRGCYVAFRMALDHPAQVAKLVVMDGVPILEALERCDARFAERWYHWFFFAQPETPERVINADPMAWYRPDAASWVPRTTQNSSKRSTTRRPSERCSRTTALGWAWIGITILLTDRPVERSAVRSCSSGRPAMTWNLLYGDPLAIWRGWADDLRGWPIDSGHHVAEENPRRCCRLPDQISYRAANAP
jgi:haloacetate dehalogenase